MKLLLFINYFIYFKNLQIVFLLFYATFMIFITNLIKMNKLIFLLLFLFNITYAQYKKSNFIELGIAFASNKVTFNINAHHVHGITKNKKLKVGYGLRFTNFWATNQNYTSAPAQLAKNKTGPAVLFTKKSPQNVDSISVRNSQINFLNVFVILQYTFFDKLDIGINIDVIGLGFGSAKNAVYQSLNTNKQENTIATPTNINLLLIDVNDRGNLNSELFVRYWITKKWAIKASLIHQFAEIITNTEVQQTPFANDRFRLISDFVSLGVSFKPWSE